MADSERRFKASLMNVAKWAYWILGGMAVAGGSYYFYTKLERPITGVLVFMGSVLALYFYYVKWFVIPAKKADWPPYQTPCPDYLTLYASENPDDKTKQYKCVDFVGVSRNGRLKRADPASISSQINNPDFYISIDPNEDMQALRARIASYGLTWTSLFGDK